MAEIIGTGIDEEELRRQQEEAERIAREEAARAEEEAAAQVEQAQQQAAEATEAAQEQAQQQAESAAQETAPLNPAAPETPDPVFAGVRSGGMGRITAQDKLDAQFMRETREAVQDTRFKVSSYDTAEGYDQSKNKAHMTSMLVGHAADLPIEEETGNTVSIDYRSIRNKEQAYMMMMVYSDDKAKVKGGKKLASALGVDYESFLAEAENYVYDKYGRNVFSTPYSSAAKNRAYTATLDGIGLMGVDGSPLDVGTATTADIFRACKMDPSGETADAVYALVKEAAKIPGNPWYGMDVKADMFKFVDNADLTSTDYKDWVDDINTSFTFSDGLTDDNLAAYVSLYDDIHAQFGDNPRVVNYLIRDLNKSFGDHTGHQAPTKEQAERALAETEAARLEAVNGADSDEKAREGRFGAILDWVSAGVDWLKNLGKKETATGEPVEYQTVEEIIKELDAGKSSGGSSPIMSGGTASVNGQEMSVSKPIASTSMPSAGELFPDGGTQEETGFDNPLGLSQEALEQNKAKEAIGPIYNPEQNYTAFMDYDAEMTDEQAWAAYRAGYRLAPENYNQISRYAGNPEINGVIYGEAAEYQAGSGGSSSALENMSIQSYRKHGHFLGELAQDIAASDLDRDGKATAEMALMQLTADIYDMWADPQSGLSRPKGANMYDHVFETDQAFLERYYSIKDSLKAANTAYSDNVVKEQEEREARLAGYTEAMLNGRGDQAMADALADVYSQDWVDVESDDRRNALMNDLHGSTSIYADGGTFWQGESMAAMEYRAIKGAGSNQGAMDFRQDLIQRTGELIDSYTTAAHNIGTTLEEFLGSAGITSADQLMNIAYNGMQMEGKSLLADAGFQSAIDTASTAHAGSVGALINDDPNYLKTGDQIGLGADIGWTNYWEGMAQAGYIATDIATHGLAVQNIQNEYVGKYGLQAAEMYRRDLNEVIASGALSQEMAAELQANMGRAYSIFDVGYEIDANGLKGILRQSQAELGKKLDALNAVVGTLPPEQQRLVGIVSGFTQNLTGMGMTVATAGIGRVIGAPAAAANVLGSIVGTGATTFSSAYDSNVHEKGMSKGVAASAAFFEAMGMTLIENGNTGSLTDLFFGGAGVEGMQLMARKGKRNLVAAMGGTLVSNAIGEGLEEGAQTIGEHVFDILDAEWQAIERGEGFSPSRTLKTLEAGLRETDYAALGKEALTSFGAGMAYGAVFGIAGVAKSGRAAFKDAQAFNKYESVKLATQIAEGSIEATDENLGKLYSLMGKDLSDPAYCRYLDKGSVQATKDRRVMTAMLENTAGETLNSAVGHAMKAQDYRDKADAANVASETAKEQFFEIGEKVENGELKPSEMDDALAQWQKAQTAYNEAYAAANKEITAAGRDTDAWLKACMERAGVLTSEGMKVRMGQIANARIGLAKRLDVLYSKAEQARADYEASLARDAKAQTEVDYAESAVFSEDAEIDEELAAEESETLESLVDTAVAYQEDIANAESADTQVAASSSLPEVVNKAQEKIGETFDQAYEVYRNVGDAAAYNELAKKHNDAVRKLREAGIEAGDTGELELIDESAYTPGEAPKVATQAEKRADRSTVRKYSRMSEAEAMAEAEVLMSDLDGLNQSTADASDGRVDEETSAALEQRKQETEHKLALLDESMAVLEAEKTGSEEYAYAQENLDEETSSAIAWPSKVRERIAGAVPSASAEEVRTGEPSAKLTPEAEAAMEATYSKRAQDRRTRLEQERAAKEETEKKAARREHIKDVATGTTKEQREAAQVEQRTQKNIDTMDAEAFIEEKYPNATEEEKNEIRKRFAEDAKRSPGEAPKDLTDFIARIAKKFKVAIKFVDTLDGAEGKYDGKSILIARDATPSEIVRKVILHELTHRAESSGLYKKLSGMILDMKYGGDQTKMDADIQSAISRYQAFYVEKGRKNTFTEENAKQEIVADFMGEILNGNQEMIDRLVADEPSLAQRIADTIKSAIDKLRGVSDPEVERMRRVVRTFEKALKKSNGTAGNGGEKYSLKKMPNGTLYVEVDTDQDIFEGHDPSEYPGIVREYIKKRFRHTVIGEGENRAFVDARTGHEYTNPAKRISDDAFESKMRAAPEMDNLLKASVYMGNPGPDKRHPEFPGGFDLRDVVFRVSGKLFSGRLNIGIDAQNRRRLYDMTKIKSLDPEIWVKQHGGAAAQVGHQSSNVIIPDNASVDNSKFSLPSGDALDAEIRAWRAGHQSQINAAITNDGVSQFAEKTVQRAVSVPVQVKREFQTNPLLRSYAKDTNAAQFERAMGNIERDGYEAEVNRLLDAETFSAEDTVEAGAIAISAFEAGDVSTGLEMALKYRTVGTEQAQAMQSRKMFAGMSPTHIKLKVAGETEQMLSDFIEGHQPKAKEVNERAKKADDAIRDLRGGDEAARAMEDGTYTIDANNSEWGVLINEKQKALIDFYGLNKVKRPGIHYNRATTKQRMLEAILVTPDPDANSGNGLTLTQRLEWMKEGKAVVTQADLNYIADQMRQYSEMPDVDQAARAGDLALARAFEAYGNIKQPTKLEKARTWRYVSMLLSLPSAERNVIGNSVMNAVNAATHDTVGVFADWATSLFTGKRTTANISFKERADGWNAWADETANTFRDYFTDKADATPSTQGEDRFNKNQRGRVYQTELFEDMRQVEGFLMSVGDRNFWKKAYVNSLAEQQRVADMNGVDLDYDKACEIAKADANYATFNEDSFVRNWLSQARQNPYVGFVLDMVMPFTGVPTNITKRMVEYSPIGMGWTFLKHAGRAVTGSNFDQKSFVDGISRGLSGTALWLIGMGLGELGAINLGTGGEDDEKVYNLKASMGEQYSPFIRIGDENISLATFAPAVSPIIMGATAYDILKEDDDKLKAFQNAMVASLNQIFDASYMSGLADLFDSNGTFAENALNTVVTNAISQNVPAFMTQTATFMDPYVRDTKDASAIMQAVKNGLIARIPGVREQYLNEKTDITGKAFESKEGIRNFVDPFTTTKVNEDPALIELDRLYDELGSSAHIPSYLVKTSGKVTVLAKLADDRKVNMDRSAGENKLTLTANERNHYNRMYSTLCFDGTGDAKYQTIGRIDTKFEGIREVMGSRKYQRASDEEKAEMISDILSKAKLLTQAQMVIDKGYMK